MSNVKISLHIADIIGKTIGGDMIVFTFPGHNDMEGNFEWANGKDYNKESNSPAVQADGDPDNPFYIW